MNSAKQTLAVSPPSPLERRIYFIMSLIIAGVVAAGFSRTIGARLFHPSSPRPIILYVHAALFSGWIVLFITQTALIWTRNVKLHRKLGLRAIPLGVAIPIVGVWTALAMGRLHVQQKDMEDTDAAEFLIVSLYDMVSFAIPFACAVYWRKRPEFHRRLMMIATCALTSAAIGRLIPVTASDAWIYIGVDLLILLVVGCDFIATKRIHPVYLYGLPALLLGQTITLYVDLSRSREWLALAHRLIG
jgi:hypothetical protein